MFKKISSKVTIYVNLILLVIMILGTYFICQNQSQVLEKQVLDRARMESILGAKITGMILEEAIDNGILTSTAVFDTNYEEIPGFNPPKYHSKYDFYLDKALLAAEDEFLKDESVIRAVAIDRSGYIPTHNTRFQHPLTWDEKVDSLSNRTKQILNDSISKQAAANTKDGFIQKYEMVPDQVSLTDLPKELQELYQREAGQYAWDVSSPIMVKNKHWGNFRVAMSMVKTNDQKNILQLHIISTMLVILIVSFIAVRLIVNKSLSPLNELTERASELADGDVDEPIKVDSKDEIGHLADVLERLRISIKIAMDKLRKSSGA